MELSQMITVCFCSGSTAVLHFCSSAEYLRKLFLPLHTNTFEIPNNENSLSSASTESDSITSLCLPSAAQLSRWINPPPQCRHLSSFPSQVVPIETLSQRGRCVCSFPKALSPLRGRHRANRQAACSDAVA